MDPEKVEDGHLVVIGELSRHVRIDTQIHRRRAAKAFSPLVLEWEQAKPVSPDQHAGREQP
ncbi:MAG: hypothetical protein OEV01_12040 [Nitrospira sp.]|nr:hypothetical protein [Nitrospira sp.]MDH5194168.1 hypothetical protein [Nitrospira sp.]